jgi:Holliday junction resolvase RusA-like endonuclease
VRLPNGGWHLRIGIKLQSPNRKSGHAMVQHRERTDWFVAVENALLVALDVRTAADYAALKRPAPRVPVRLALTREVPSQKHFITDLDNLWFMAKRLVDALKANGLIYDDAMAWCERPRPRQRVSHDGQHWTDIVIEPLAAQEASRG